MKVSYDIGVARILSAGVHFFHRPGGAGAPTAPPGYAYELRVVAALQ